MKKVYLARGPFCYGFGSTVKEAEKNCAINKPHKSYYSGKFKMEVFEYLKKYSAEVQISDMDGGITGPKEAEFKQIK